MEPFSPPGVVRVGAVTRAMVHERTRELAVLAGRRPTQIMYPDYWRARCEVTGETDVGRQDSRLDAGTPTARRGSRKS